jgi:hypothetical protein
MNSATSAASYNGRIFISLLPGLRLGDRIAQATASPAHHDTDARDRSETDRDLQRASE